MFRDSNNGYTGNGGVTLVGDCVIDVNGSTGDVITGDGNAGVVFTVDADIKPGFISTGNISICDGIPGDCTIGYRILGDGRSVEVTTGEVTIGDGSTGDGSTTGEGSSTGGGSTGGGDVIEDASIISLSFDVVVVIFDDIFLLFDL